MIVFVKGLTWYLALQPALHKFLLLLSPLLAVLEKSEVSATCNFLHGTSASPLWSHTAVQLPLSHYSPAGAWNSTGPFSVSLL